MSTIGAVPTAAAGSYGPLPWIVNRLPVICAVFPLAWIALSFLTAALAALSLGHWPIASIDDPKGIRSAPFMLSWAVLFGSVYIYPWVLVSGLVSSLWSGQRHGWRRAVLLTIAQVVSMFLAVAYLVSDPAGIFYWLLD